MLVFSTETSCDETSVCLINNNKRILSHIVYSQQEHKEFGGVIPELASRSHLQILQKISKEAINQAKIDVREIDLFCATCGPGLIGGLLVGSTFTKAMAIGLNKPFVPINHLEGHLLSPTINNDIYYPFISFLLTGGHTQIYLVKDINDYELLGETLDDAIGEAFDKVAKLIGMNYPGGAELEKAAKNGNCFSYDLPQPLDRKKNLNFSFSGIKTAVNLIVQKKNNINNNKKFISDIAASFQETITQILESKFKLTHDELIKRNIHSRQISLVGGVAANKYILNKIQKLAKNFNYSIILPPKDMLSDNAAMIGWACIKKYTKKKFSDINFKANPRLHINC